MLSDGSVMILTFGLARQSQAELFAIENQWEELFGPDSEATEDERKSAYYTRRVVFDSAKHFFGEKVAQVTLKSIDIFAIQREIDETLQEEVRFPLTAEYYS